MLFVKYLCTLLVTSPFALSIHVAVSADEIVNTYEAAGKFAEAAEKIASSLTPTNFYMNVPKLIQTHKQVSSILVNGAAIDELLEAIVVDTEAGRSLAREKPYGSMALSDQDQKRVTFALTRFWPRLRRMIVEEFRKITLLKSPMSQAQMIHALRDLEEALDYIDFVTLDLAPKYDHTIRDTHRSAKNLIAAFIRRLNT